MASRAAPVTPAVTGAARFAQRAVEKSCTISLELAVWVLPMRKSLNVILARSPGPGRVGVDECPGVCLPGDAGQGGTDHQRREGAERSPPAAGVFAPNARLSVITGPGDGRSSWPPVGRIVTAETAPAEMAGAPVCPNPGAPWPTL